VYDVMRDQRRNRILLAVNLCLLAGVLGLFAFGRRGLVEWVLLVSSVVNLMSTLAGRRALSRLRAATTDRDRAG
jgi:hypothetical protein